MSFRHCSQRLVSALRYPLQRQRLLCYCNSCVILPYLRPTKLLVFNNLEVKRYSTPISTSVGYISAADYERISIETLETLTEYFEDIIEKSSHLRNPDIIFGDGVLTVQFGEPYGTYVINRQSPNLQIWLSSPISGPKRYDFIDGHWVYKHDGVSLHDLLNQEISKIVKLSVDFKRCSYSSPSKQK